MRPVCWSHVFLSVVRQRADGDVVGVLPGVGMEVLRFGFRGEMVWIGWRV